MDTTKIRPGWVYILSNKALARNIYKIGLSQVDCLTRMRAIETRHRLPDAWTLEFRIPVSDAFAAEKAIHDSLADRRLGGEFFRVPLDVAKQEVRRVARRWRCTEAEVGVAGLNEGFTLALATRAERQSNAAKKAHTTRRRVAAANAAVATRRKNAAERLARAVVEAAEESETP